MQANNDPVLIEYRSPFTVGSHRGALASKAAGILCTIAAVAAFIGDWGFGTTNDFGAGLVFGAVLLFSWCWAVMGIVTSGVALWQSRARRGWLALLMNIGVLAASIMITHFLPGPQLRSAGMH